MLALSTFTFWKKKLRQCIKESSIFYPLTVIENNAESNSHKDFTDSGLRLLLGQNRFIVEMAKDFSPETLSSLITTLEKLDADVG